ncbi:MAG: copper amine oxidase N-terminal domain-containing protein, partial [Defluviitaleaceae bacterium]|nr:copper amine oxidase N-terminal domain-containing protein [Defluviitaleaceae bacterium]
MRNSAMDRAASKTTGIMPNSPMSKATNMGGLLRRTAAILAAVVMSVAATPAVDVTAANEPNTLAATTASGNNTTIVLTIGSTTYTVNGVPSTSTSAPVIIGGSTMTPARLVAEALGASVDWDGNTQRVTIVGHNAQGQPLTVVLTIGSTTYTVGGIAHQASAAPVIVGGSTMTPARLVAELLGASVDWDGNTQRVTITRSQAEQVATVPPAT